MSMEPNNFAIVSKGSSVEDVRAVIKGKKTKKNIKIINLHGGRRLVVVQKRRSQRDKLPGRVG